MTFYFDEESCDGQCNHYKALCKQNGLLVLTKEDSMILDLIDKILDPKEKQEQLQKYLHLAKIQNKESTIKVMQLKKIIV